MVQITCPNCDASYTVPDSALGTKGRKVSCAKCGHSWHAMPPEPEPLVLNELVESPKAAAPVDELPPPPEPVAEPDVTPAPPPPVAATQDQLREDRARQLAEIRQIVDEVQQDPAAEPRAPMPSASANAEPAANIPFPEEDKPAEAPSNEPRSFMKSLADRINDQPEEPQITTPPPPPPPPQTAQVETDDLRDRIAQRSVDQKAGTAKVTERSRRKMLKKHNRRAAKKAASDKRGSGAFATGFLLVLIVVSVLSSLYLLAPQISAQVPGAEPILNNYKAKVDEARAGAFGLVEDFMTKVEPVIGGDESGSDG